MTRRSIPTRYRNVLFRSKLEADWARVFDAMKLAWKYESEGHYFGDTFYLPDFFLPQSRQYVEVKGVSNDSDFELNDALKVLALVRYLPPRRHTGEDTSDIPIVGCLPGGRFFGWGRNGRPLGVSLFQCIRCRGWWFLVECMGWKCQCCGFYQGNAHIITSISSPIENFPELTWLRSVCGTLPTAPKRGNHVEAWR